MATREGAVRLPPVALSQSDKPVLAVLWDPSQDQRRKPWKKHLLEPVLLGDSRTESRWLTHAGGPPRAPRAQHDQGLLGMATPDAAAVAAAAAFEASTEASSPPPAPMYRVRKPPVPRVAARRLAAMHESGRSAKGLALLGPPKPPGAWLADGVRTSSQNTASEGWYTREVVAPAGGFWRHTLDAEVESRDADSAAWAEHRMDCQRTAQQWSRDQAARWRSDRVRREQIVELRWRLGGSGRVSKPWLTQDGQEAYLRAPSPEDGRLPGPRDGHRRKWRGRPIAADNQALERGHMPQRQESAQTADTEEQEDGGGSHTPNSPDAASSVPSVKRRSLRARIKALSKKRKEKIMQLQRAFHDAVASGKAPEEGSEHHGSNPSPDPLDSESGAGGSARHSFVFQKETFNMMPKLHVAKNAGGDQDNGAGEYAVKDVEACKRVFDMYDRHGTNTLDQAELRACLAKMGLRARNKEEREGMREILRQVDCLEITFADMINSIIPKVRRRLAEIQRAKLKELFDEGDADGSGMYCMFELVKALHRMGTFPGQDQVEDALYEVVPAAAKLLHNINGGLIMTKDVLDFEAFRGLVANLQERTEAERVERFLQIAQSEHLDEQQQELWMHDLVEAWDTFHRFADDSQVVDESQLVSVARDLGQLPKKRDQQQLMRRLMDEEKQAGMSEVFEFSQCLRIFSELRVQEIARLEQVFYQYDINKSGGLSLQECQRALLDCDIVPKSREEQFEILQLIEEFDEDGSGEVDMQEFQHLTAFVRERLRKSRREAERECAFQYGWGQDEFEELRMTFIAEDEDISENLDVDEVLSALETLRPRHWTQAEAKEFLAEYGVYKVNFIEFLGVIHAFDAREAHLKVAEQLGMDKAAALSFARLWRELEPQPDGTIPRDRLVQALQAIRASQASRWPGRNDNGPAPGDVVASVLPMGALQADFVQFLKVVQRMGAD